MEQFCVKGLKDMLFGAVVVLTLDRIDNIVGKSIVVEDTNDPLAGSNSGVAKVSVNIFFFSARLRTGSPTTFSASPCPNIAMIPEFLA